MCGPVRMHPGSRSPHGAESEPSTHLPDQASFVLSGRFPNQLAERTPPVAACGGASFSARPPTRCTARGAGRNGRAGTSRPTFSTTGTGARPRERGPLAGAARRVRRGAAQLMAVAGEHRTAIRMAPDSWEFQHLPGDAGGEAQRNRPAVHGLLAQASPAGAAPVPGTPGVVQIPRHLTRGVPGDCRRIRSEGCCFTRIWIPTGGFGPTSRSAAFAPPCGLSAP